MLGCSHGQRDAVRQPAHEPFGEAGGDVLDDQDRDRERLRKRLQNRGERLRAARRRADADDRGGALGRGRVVEPPGQPGARMADDPDAAQDLHATAQRGRVGACRVAEVDRLLVHRVQRTGGERGGGVGRARPHVRREHRGSGSGRCHDLLHCLEPGHPGKLEIHRHEVRSQSTQGRDRLLGRGEDADDLDLITLLEHAPEPLRVRGRVVADEDAPRRASRGPAQEPTSCPMVSSSACWSKLRLAMYASAPASRPRAAVFLFAPRGDDDDGKLGVALVGPDGADELDAVDFRHLDVRDDEADAGFLVQTAAARRGRRGRSRRGSPPPRGCCAGARAR